jgi:hypothetical protein
LVKLTPGCGQSRRFGTGIQTPIPDRQPPAISAGKLRANLFALFASAVPIARLILLLRFMPAAT